MLNRRKALIGWLVYTGAKPIARRMVASKAKSAAPSGGRGSRVPKVAAVVAGIGAVAGGLLFWRNRREDDAASDSAASDSSS